MFDTPILLNCFNRPDNTRRVIESLSKVQPSKLYVGIDAPRGAFEEEKVNEVVNAVNGITWNCELHILREKTNKGVQRAIYDHINWFFENEEFGIILEDDIVPYPEFYPYCSELLDMYKNNDKVACISGWSYFYQRIPDNYEYTYYFSHVQSSWGWATWRDKWQPMKLDFMSSDFSSIEQNLRKEGIDDGIIKYYRYIFNNKGVLASAWDYQFLFSCLMIPNRYCIQPMKRLVENIGYGSDATHPSSHNPNVVERVEDCLVIKHPESVEYLSWLDNERNKQTGEIIV